MSVQKLIPGWLSSRTAYECTFCGSSFEAERLNCPACGFDVREA